MSIKERFDRFVANVNGQKIEVSDATNQWQCMDLAYLWAFSLNIPKGTIQRLYAYEVFTKANDYTKEFFDVISNTPDGVPQAGDLVIFGTQVGIAGHICIASGVGDTSSFQSLDQNWGGKQYASMFTHNYAGCLGWLRPKMQAEECIITDQTKIPQIDNMEVQAIRSIINDLKASQIALQKATDTLKTQVSELTLLVNNITNIVNSRWTWLGTLTGWKARLANLKALLA